MAMNPGDARLLEHLRASLDPHAKLEAEWTCETVGEEFHQKALEATVLQRPRDVRTELRITAELVRERENDRDPHAIRVEIDGRKVGRLPKSVPQYHRAALKVLLDRGIRRFADARILGRSDNEQGAHYEVCVELPDTATLGAGEQGARHYRSH